MPRTKKVKQPVEPKQPEPVVDERAAFLNTLLGMSGEQAMQEGQSKGWTISVATHASVFTDWNFGGEKEAVVFVDYAKKVVKVKAP